MTRAEALCLKSGDLVTCIDPSGTNPWRATDYEALVLYKQYTVKYILDKIPYGVIIIDENPRWTFSHERFIK
jgi:hypothetical protein